MPTIPIATSGSVVDRGQSVELVTQDPGLAHASSRKAQSRSPIARIQRLHELLASHRYPNCQRVAAEFEVSPKTIFRDLEFMRDQLRLPIKYGSKHHGYYYSQSVECPIILAAGAKGASILSQEPVSGLSRKRLRQRQNPERLVSARIRFDSSAAAEIYATFVTSERNMKTCPDGRIEFLLEGIPLREIERWILSWGAQACVVEPQWLRERVMALARELIEIYRST